MSRTSLKQQLMREQTVQQERKEALQRQQKMQNNTRLTSQHLSIGGAVSNATPINNHHHGRGTIVSPLMKLPETNSCPNFLTGGFKDALTSSHSTSTTVTTSTTVNHQSNQHQQQNINLSAINHSGSGPQSPFPLSPDSPLSGPRSSASEIDEYWEDVQRTLVLEMPDLMDQGGSGPGGGANNGGGGCGIDVGESSNSINVIHHHHNSSHNHHTGHHAMDPIASTLPADIGFVFNPHQIYGGEDSQQSCSHLSEATKMSSSCPPLSTSCPPLSSDAEYSAWERERKKKDAHNKIERRRRYNINDRIKELSTLLPTQDETRYYELVKDMKQNKGTILKASVDFLRSLKRDVTRIPELERQNRELEVENRKMSLRIQQLEQDLRRNSLIGEGRNLYKPDPSAPKSIRFGHGQQHAHHQQTHQGTPPHPQSLPHHLHQQHSVHRETDYWINSSFNLGDENIQHQQHHHQSTMASPLMQTNASTPTTPDNNNDIIEASDLYSSRMVNHPMIKQEYNVSPSQSSSGLGSLSSPSSLSATFLPLSQLLMADNNKDPILTRPTQVKGEILSPQVMDVCD